MSTTSSRWLRRAVVCAVAAAALLPAVAVASRPPGVDPSVPPSPPTTEVPLPEPPPPPPDPRPTVPLSPIRQGDTGSAQSAVPAPPGARLPPVRPSLGEPRFVLHAVRLRAVDESGPDWPGSDEVFAVWDTPQDRMAASSVFGDVDSGETRTFAARESCITPIEVVRDVPGGPVGGPLIAGDGDQWACGIVGRPAPIEFTIWFFESGGDWWPFYTCFQETSPTPEECRDDLIGVKTLSLGISDLLPVLPNVGSTFEETVTLGGPCGHVEYGEICGYSPLFPTGPEYTFTYRITRTADAPPVLAP